jgi:hypothetical protein
MHDPFGIFLAAGSSSSSASSVSSTLGGLAVAARARLAAERLSQQIVCGAHGLVLLVQLVLVSLFFAW